jgi:hypothetical protein
MADNNAVTKADLQIVQEELQNALSSVVAQLTKLIQETAAATEAKLTAEMDKRFQSADRQRRAFREEVENRFHEIRGMIDTRFDRAKEYTDEAVVEKIRELKALLDGQAGMASRLDTEQRTLGALYDRLRTDLDATQKSNDDEITGLKHRVTKLEEEVFSSPAENA